MTFSSVLQASPPAPTTLCAAAGRFEIAVSYRRQHADVICVLLDSEGRADGDHGVAVFSQPVCAGGAVRLDPKGDASAWTS